MKCVWSWTAGYLRLDKKSPDGRLEAATGADQPGMGMTNRV
jgi:hypothetical protein